MEEKKAVAPVAPPTVAPVASPVGCELVNNYAWDTKVAYAVCMAESGGNPSASNWNDQHNGCVGSHGLMQLACIHTGGLPEHNPQKNMDKAFEIYSRSGWQPWGAWSSGKYLEFM